MFRKVLIANRGEIAVRIIRTCRALGIRTVAVYSEADRQALHTMEADEAVLIGPPPAQESYLNIRAILEAARRTGAEALHPGYGLLAENPELAQACQEAGIVFVGPPPQAMRAMADKAAARRLVSSLGIPVIPGYDDHLQRDEDLLRAAQELGFPIMVKAAAGGGGRGMRLVGRLEELPQALESARREAQGAFGDGRLLLERAIAGARHIEVQIAADAHGHVIHLGERDCSLQRRHQKVMEEAPSPSVDEGLRHRLGEAATAIARAIGYRNLGTVEFLVDSQGRFYFLEMNTRLQVEHGVTEMVTGLDLVAMQLAIATGEPLPLHQEDLRIQGHAIECRIYAEDPLRGFLPRSGRIHVFRPPQGENIRHDVGIYEGVEVSPYYDPLLAKVLAWGSDRQQALMRMAWALSHYRLDGVQSNLAFLQAVLRHPAVQTGSVTVDMVEGLDMATLLAPPAEALLALLAALATGALGFHDPWLASGPWRVGGRMHLVMEHAGEELTLEAQREWEGWWTLALGEHKRRARLSSPRPGQVVVEGEGSTYTAQVEALGRGLWVTIGDRSFLFRWPDPARRAATAGPKHRLGHDLRAPLNGTVIRVMAREGDVVQAHQVLVIIEAMKMEHNVEAPVSGRVWRVRCREGQQVEEGQVLIELAPLGGEEP
jgi:acetyl-CoA carboxylase biotin carboxylase subunit